MYLPSNETSHNFNLMSQIALFYCAAERSGASDIWTGFHLLDSDWLDGLSINLAFH